VRRPSTFRRTVHHFLAVGFRSDIVAMFHVPIVQFFRRKPTMSEFQSTFIVVPSFAELIEKPSLAPSLKPPGHGPNRVGIVCHSGFGFRERRRPSGSSSP